MRIDDASPSDVAFVARNMRSRDEQEFLAVSCASSRRELVSALCARYGGGAGAMCASDDEPIAVFALVNGRPNVVTLMFFATDRFPKIALRFTRFVRNHLFPHYKRAGVHRIECASIEGYDETHRWLRVLGLEYEAEMRGYGKGGETFHQFAWVSDAVSSG